MVDTGLVVRQLFNCLCDNFSASLIGCILSLNFHLFGDSSIYLERLVWTGGALLIHWQSCCLILGASITGSSNSYQYGKDWVFLKFLSLKCRKYLIIVRTDQSLWFALGTLNSWAIPCVVRSPNQRESQSSTWERRETGSTVLVFRGSICISLTICIFDNEARTFFHLWLQ